MYKVIASAFDYSNSSLFTVDFMSKELNRSAAI
jgi:hypothetical protein